MPGIDSTYDTLWPRRLSGAELADAQQFGGEFRRRFQHSSGTTWHEETVPGVQGRQQAAYTKIGRGLAAMWRASREVAVALPTLYSYDDRTLHWQQALRGSLGSLIYDNNFSARSASHPDVRQVDGAIFCFGAYGVVIGLSKLWATRPPTRLNAPVDQCTYKSRIVTLQAHAAANEDATGQSVYVRRDITNIGLYLQGTQRITETQDALEIIPGGHLYSTLDRIAGQIEYPQIGNDWMYPK